MILKKGLIACLVIIVVVPSNVRATIFAFNAFRPFDINLRHPYWKGTSFKPTTWGEFGYKTMGFNGDHDSVNVLQIWTPTQSTIGMLQGFPATFPASEYLQSIGDPVDDGVRGHIVPTGKLDFRYGLGIMGRYYFCKGIDVALFIPAYSMKLSNIKFEDLTPRGSNLEDIEVRENLTGILPEVIKELDPSYNINGWDRTGLGDITIMGEWMQDYPQRKDFLKNVTLDTRLGLTLPTGLRKNEDDLFSIPFGFDGSVGLVFGGGIQVTWLGVEHGIRGGVDAQFFYLFGNTRERRIKVAANQTDLLLLAKVGVHNDPGFTQRFNLYLQMYKFHQGLSGAFVYQVFKHSEDTISLSNNMYSSAIANTAASLDEWEIHQFIFKLDYDFQGYISDDASIKPQLTAFYKLPMSGKRAVLANTFGFVASLNF